MSRRRAVPAMCAVAVLVVLSGCTHEAEVASKVVVKGEIGSVPELDYTIPLVASDPVVDVIVEGTGPELVDGGPVLVDFYAESGDDGSVTGDTYSSEPRPYLLSPEALGVDIYNALKGQTVGSRIMQVVPAAEGQPAPTIAVFDILPTRASGTPVTPREGLPTVELAEDGTPSVTIPEGAVPPTELIVQPLLHGDGPQVSVGQVVTVQYVGVTWSDGVVFDSSWTPGSVPRSFPIGVESVIAGWDKGLVEQTVGSQVLLVVPPSEAYGGKDHILSDQTLVFVVDILSTGSGPEQDGA